MKVDIRQFRTAQRDVPLRHYELLFVADRWEERTLLTARKTIDTGWEFKGFPTLCLRPPIAWDQASEKSRSWGFHLHSWDALGPVLSAYDTVKDPGFLDFALSVALDWAANYPTLEVSSEFAWYDMAIGVRAYRLAYLLDAAARSASYEDEVVACLVNCVLLHAAAFADENRFAAHSNHGFYFAAGQAALARRFPTLPGMTQAQKQADERLGELVRTQFTEEGVHREHSSDYQRMVSDTFYGLLEAGLFTDRELWELCDRSHEVLAWLILPDGRLTQFGDSPQTLMLRSEFHRVRNDALRFVLSGGQSGKPPSQTMRAFPASGYVVMRNNWSTISTESSYLAQTCAFHSRVHKHADDLSFIWYDRGHELLVDSGRFGYVGRTEVSSDLWKDGFWYSDPRRIYVESTRAHNTVQIDGRNFPRFGVKPYGSALIQWGEKVGVYYAESRVLHWGCITHTRVLLFKPTEWLIVVDLLLDQKGKPHQFIQRFHFAPELELLSTKPSPHFAIPCAEERLHLTSLLPADEVDFVKGQTAPDLLGWVSREDGRMTPLWTGGYSVDSSVQHAFATLFTFGEDVPQPDTSSAVTSLGSEARLCWKLDGSAYTVRFQRRGGKRLELEYQRSRSTG